MDKLETLKVMNEMGKKKSPFFFIIDYKMENCKVFSPEMAKIQGFLFNFNGISNCNKTNFYNHNISLSTNPIPFIEYEKAFNIVQQELNYGNSYLVNLTFPTPLTINLNLEEIFHLSNAKYKVFYPNKFVVFSPEAFVKISDGKISTFPMKGTIDAQTQNASNLLLNNKKEMAEHATIVDLLRNDLSRVASKVIVAKYRYIDEVNALGKKLLQVSSHIEGQLPENYCENIGTILFEMLPAGSVTGAPKPKTLEIIDRVENFQRGYYTGVAGYFDGTNLDSCVLIRFIEKTENGNFVYKSGGGITSQSIAKQEYNELNDKIYVPIG